jgi:E3 ubiquitin-protein ligase SHPRH
MPQILIALTAAHARIQKDQDPEKILLKTAISGLRQLIADQSEEYKLSFNSEDDRRPDQILTTLEADLTLFRKAFNQRVLYFR